MGVDVIVISAPYVLPGALASGMKLPAMPTMKYSAVARLLLNSTTGLHWPQLVCADACTATAQLQLPKLA
jgi:hypothetical protein